MRLEFEFARGGVLGATGQAKARHTLDCIAGAQPLAATALQARWSGRELFLPVDLPSKPPRENQTIRASLGDVIYFREWEGQYEHTGFEAIGLFYGPEIVREWRGEAPVNVIARIDPGQFALLEELGDRIWRQGGEDVTLRIAT